VGSSSGVGSLYAHPAWKVLCAAAHDAEVWRHHHDGASVLVEPVSVADTEVVALTLLGDGTRCARIEPWQLGRAQLIPFASTYPLSYLQDEGPSSYSEAGLHAYSLWRRRNETIPPQVPVFPVGTWAIDAFDCLWHLRRYCLHDPCLFFPEGNPYSGSAARTSSAQYPWLVEKYAAWLRAGHEPPPLTACEMETGRIRVLEGHHRATSLVLAGRHESLLWVSLAYCKPSGFCTDLTHPIAVECALCRGEPVPPAVLAGYPHLLIVN
jgi:hypothetical protein